MITQAEVDAFRWHHQIDFGNGVMSKGNTKKDVLQAQANAYFKPGIKGKSVIDIGCWDGFNSFEAERLGASRVLAVDHFAWSEECWGDRGAFALAKRGLNSSVDVRDISLEDTSVEAVGQFDIVLFLGVLYHLRNPLADLLRVSKIAKEMIVVETHLDALDYPRPAMVFYPTTELANDHTNWWGPNPDCVTAMLKDSGFSRVKFRVHPLYHNRGIFHGIR